jgi:UDPglucose 6-dehydrogenase
MTEWGDYQRPPFKEMLQRMRSPVVFDGRNLYEPWQMERLGFVYHRGRAGGRGVIGTLRVP